MIRYLFVVLFLVSFSLEVVARHHLKPKDDGSKHVITDGVLVFPVDEEEGDTEVNAVGKDKHHEKHEQQENKEKTVALKKTEPVVEEVSVAVEEKPLKEEASDLEKNSQLLDSIARQKALLDQVRQVKGEAAFREGLLEYKKFKFDSALKYFKQAEVFNPDDKKLQQYIKLCQQQLGADRSNDSKIGFLNEGKEVFNQELIVLSRYHLEQAEKSFQESISLWNNKDDEIKSQADQILKKAELELRKSEDAAMQLRGWNGKAELLKSISETDSKIKKQLAMYRDYFVKRKEVLARKKAVDQSRLAAEERSGKVEALLLQAKRDYLNKEYEKSLRISELVLDRDPKNDGAMLLIKKNRVKMNRKTLKKIKKRSQEEWKKNMERIDNASIFYADPVVFPDNWHEINRRKAIKIKRASQPEWVKQLTQKLRARVTMLLPDNGLQEISEMMQEQTGVNIVLDPNLDLEEARVTGMNLKDVPLESALSLILRNITLDEPLEYRMKDGALFITTKGNQETIGRLESINYDVTDLITSFSDQGLVEGEASLGQSVTNIEANEEEDTITTDVLIDLLKRSIDPPSWEIEGVTAEAYESGVILITQTSLVHDKIAKMLTKFRKLQKLQVSIEVRFISSTEDDIFDIAMGLSGLNEVPLEDSGVSVGAALYSSRENLDYDTRVATVLGSAADNAAASATDFIKLNRQNEGMFTELSIMDPIRASLIFHALSRKENVKDLIAPRLTVLNNKTGLFRRQVNTHYVENVTGSGETGMTPQPGIVSSGIQLEVRPTVSSDRKYITLTLTPIVTQLINLRPRNIQLLSVQGGTGTASTSRSVVVTNATIEAPEIENWQLQTTAQVPDGGVLFVGGRMGHQENKVNRSVPILGKIPVLGRLFRTEGKYERFSNLIISVRAKVLIFEEMENKIP